MCDLEIFISNIKKEFININDINIFINIIKSSDSEKKCTIVKYKLDKLISYLDKFIKLEKNNIYNIFPPDIIYFLLKNDYSLFVNNLLKTNKLYIEYLIEDDKYNYKILNIIIKNDLVIILITLIDNKLKNLLSIVKIHSNYIKNYKEFENIIKKNIFCLEYLILLTVISVEYKNKYSDEDLNILKSYILDYVWINSTNSGINIIDIIIHILEILKKLNLINDDFKLSLLKKNKFIKNNNVFNNVIDLFYFYDIKISNEKYVNLIDNGLKISNFQRFGIKMDNATIELLLSKNIIPSIIEEIPNEKTMCELFKINNLEKKNIINFINYGGVITSSCLKNLFSKYSNIENNRECKMIETTIVQYYDITYSDFINYENRMSYKTGLDYLLTYEDKNNNNSCNTNKINLPDIHIIINKNKLKIFKEKIGIKTLYEYFLEYIKNNNLKIYDYCVTNNFLAKMFGVHKSCLLDINKIKIIFDNIVE
jgi:hypothetical protein